jgi:beta-lactamase superfamily II metal-dependent hydrolase
MNQITNQHLDIVIFDVEHGDCAFIQTPSGGTLMVDCGHKQDFSPAKFIKELGWVGAGGINKIIITHHDQDHISDLKKAWKILNPSRFHTNNISGDYISRKDKPQINTPKHEYVKIKRLPSVPQFQFGDIAVYHFKNDFNIPDQGDVDINYHSVVTFVEFGQFVICFPGDINNEGITALLSGDNSEQFLSYIRKTNIFIAPHHGRVSEDERKQDTFLSYLLSQMKPDLVIVSDKAIEGQNENTAATDYYAGYVESGIVFGQNTEQEKTRKVLTTRNDNTIHIQVEVLAQSPFLSSQGQRNNYYVNLNAFNKEIENHAKNTKTKRLQNLVSNIISEKYGR